jgi:hypothetical protein
VKNQKLFEMVQKFAELSEGPLNNNEFQVQRERLVKFYEKFSTDLRRIRNELGSEIETLKMRGFDRKMFQLLVKVYENTTELHKEIDPEKPYIAAEKLVHYVLDKPNAPYIDNLEFLAKHHLKRTNVDFGAGKNLQHPEMHGLENLKRLAMELRAFMAQHPLVLPPSQSNPPAGFAESLRDVPAFFAGKEDKTKV